MLTPLIAVFFYLRYTGICIVENNWDRCLQMAAVAAVGGTNVSVGIASAAFAEAVIYPVCLVKLKYYGICQGLYCVREER